MDEKKLITEIETKRKELEKLLKVAFKKFPDWVISVSGGTSHRGSAIKEFSDLSICIVSIKNVL